MKKWIAIIMMFAGLTQFVACSGSDDSPTARRLLQTAGGPGNVVL